MSSVEGGSGANRLDGFIVRNSEEAPGLVRLMRAATPIGKLILNVSRRETHFR